MAFNPYQDIDDNVTDAGDLVSFELFGTLANNVNYLMDSMPIGSIICILAGMPGVPTPDPTIWQECDGTQIENENSAIKDQPAPNFADEGRYMRAFTVVGTIGQYGGGNYKNLTHSHTGYTDLYPPGYGPVAADDNNAANVEPHRHQIFPDLTIINFQPEHFVVKHYVKIR